MIHYFCLMRKILSLCLFYLIALGAFVNTELRAQELNKEGIADIATAIHPILVDKEYGEVMILDFTDLVGQPIEKGANVADYLREEMEKRTTTYTLVSKYVQENAIRSEGLTSEDLFDEYGAAELATKLGADAVIMGVIEPGLPSDMTFLVKVISAPNAEMDYIEREKVYSEESVTEEMDKAVEIQDDGVIRFSLGKNKDKKKKRDRGGDDEEEVREENEDEYRGWSIGLNLGAYFANKKSAQFYNGSCPYTITGSVGEVRCYEIYERLTLTQQEINYILSYYNISGQQFERTPDMYPANMRYNPALLFGIHLKYNFNRDNAIVFNGNFMRLKTVDKFTLRFPPDPSDQMATENIQLFDITGEEDRFQLSLAYRMGAMMNDNTNWYFDVGATMLGTRVLSNEIFVADRTYSLFIGAANPFQIIQYQPRTDIGFGYMIGTGMEFYFESGYTMGLGLNYSRDQVVLGTYEDRIGNLAVMATFTL